MIYTGPVQSGKSSRLLYFVQSRNDAGGILSPLIDGKKYLYDISSGEKKLLEAEADDREDDTISIGKYKFKKKIFEWGKNVLKKASTENYTYLIIDEIGRLEFEGKGFSPIADELISKNHIYFSKILVVIRESLISKFLVHYKLTSEDIELIQFD